MPPLAPPSRPPDTPEFLAWTLARSCPLRVSDNWHLPDQAARELRSVFAAGEAILENRVHGDIAVERVTPGQAPQRGFSLEAALAVYGGREQVEDCCRACSANVGPLSQSTALAGCCGELPRTLSASLDLANIWSEAISALKLGEQTSQADCIPSSNWYSLWSTSPLAPAIAPIHRAIGDWATANYQLDRWPAWRQFVAALHAAADHAIPLEVRLHPPGWLEADGSWLIAAHCPRCIASWPSGGRQCGACGWRGHHVGLSRRKLRGLRPYRNLVSILDETAMARLQRDCLAARIDQSEN